MCVRFDLNTGQALQWSKMLKAWIPESDWREGADHFPGYVAPIVLPNWDGHERTLVQAQWGMIPPWAKDAQFGKKNAYNARSETVSEKPTFRNAFRSRRCVIPAAAFYERAEGRWLRMRSVGAEVLSIAGLFEPPNRHCALPTFAMVTTVPNELIGEMHDRMPVVLDPAHVDAWLDPVSEPALLRSLLIPCPVEWLEVEDAGPVSRGTRTKAIETDSLF